MKVIDAFIVKSLQEVDQHIKIPNLVNVKINSNNFWDLTRQCDRNSRYNYRFFLFVLFFSSNIQNNIKKIFMTCNLNDSKIILLSELKDLGIIYLSRKNNWQTVKGACHWISINITNEENLIKSDYFSFNFRVNSVHNIA